VFRLKKPDWEHVLQFRKNL